MADSLLDDFFAKKDKSKAKSKKKNISTEEMGKKLEESKRFAENKDKQKKTKEKTNTTVSAISVNILEQEDEEWNDFVEEREKDYSGLRIQTLSIKDKEEEFREQQMQDNEEECRNESQSGPWKMSPTSGSISQGSVATDEKEIIEETPVSTVSAITAPQQQAGKYIPPHLRSGATSATTTPTVTKKTKHGAPKIEDTNEFPTLGTTSEAFEELKGYQTVKSGTRDNFDRTTTSVSLDNKYGILSNRSKDEIQDNIE